MYKRVLCPMDGSDNADLAAKRAIRMADRYDTELHALYVVEKSRDDPERKGLEEKIAEERNEARNVVERIEREAAGVGVTVDSSFNVPIVRSVRGSTAT